MRQSIETTAPGIRHLPGNVTFLQCYISTFPPAPRGKLDCYTPMAPVCSLKILLNRFHGNYSLGIAQKIVPSVAKNACMQRGISKIRQEICDDICCNNKIYTEIVRPQNVRQWLHCYDNVLISSTWGAQFERRHLYCPYLSSQALLELNERIVRDSYWYRHFYTLCDSLFILW